MEQYLDLAMSFSAKEGVGMSKPHLRALENALARKGWRVVAVLPGDDYRISATWEIQRDGNQPSLFIDFEGMGADGDRCLPLEESSGCHVRAPQASTLYFHRVNRSRPLWERELAAFVLALDNQRTPN
jgi:hypothetical protein